ncbi:S41 family peptidase [Magnetospirillum sp. UT-4]|uniref:S41 family peptidase n=1 Tax=Magnetospirillum sp. UT-4 TaxID=2681467 RepID=UPI001384021F|nr:S41 family peptidase [Magnetospirillum sp. UT-4]CAA7620764.1 Periplasmic protease [Magnetospirillum sp. UT-4]
MKRNPAAHWIIAASLLVAGSCAPASQGSLAGPHTPYDTAEAERTFASAYSTIVERHLERITAAAVAMEGMRGLGSIDPEIGLSHLDGKVLLTAADHVVAEYPAPEDHDIKGWARLTVTAALEARGVSAAVRDADVDKVFEAVFDATLSKLDVFSRYAGPKEAREHRASRNGFGGIGVKFDLVEGEAKVIEVMEDTPAARAGLQVGDIISQIEGRSVAGTAKEDISRLLRGPVSSDLALTVRRGFKPIDVALKRALIVPITVTATLKAGGIGEFRVSSFNQRTAASLAAEIKTLTESNGAPLSGVVLDMRGNPGGLLDQAVAMADLFMKDGAIVTTRGRHPLSVQAYDAREGEAAEDIPVVVLVDGKSASAAEIVAAALQDSGRAVVVGTNSYGKGTVQTVVRLPNDGEMTLTWSRFHTPSGYALHGLGVLPTICTADDKGGADGMMAGIVHASAPAAPVSTNLTLWRHARLEDTDLRSQLRTTCPSAKRDGAFDLELAERLLADQALYRHALTLSAPAAAPSAAQAAPAAMVQQVEH